MTRHEIGPDDGFQRWLDEAAPTLNEPPRAVPRDAMWEEISHRLSADRRPRAAQPWTARKWTWPLMVAAALVLGAAIDRFMLRARVEGGARQVATVPTTERTSGGGSAIDPVKPKTRPVGPERMAEGSSTADGREPTAGGRLGRPGPSTTMRLAAQQTLAQAELLLAAYRTDDARDAQQLGRWARDVLSSTRLLLDSRAADDVTLRALLEDLELVLMQIAQLSGGDAGSGPDQTERELLDRTLREGDLLPRIRSVVPPGAATYTTGASE